MTLPRVPLGGTGLCVSRIGLGTAPLGDFYAHLDDHQAIATVEAALAAGITLLDTSPHYGNGLAEHRTGTGLRSVPRDQLVLSTKVGRVMDPHRHGSVAAPARGFVGSLPHAARFDYSYDGTMRSIDQSLLRLGTDRLDLVLIHDVDSWTHGEAMIEARYRQALDGATRALAELKGQGVIAGYGLGLDDHEMAERFLGDADYDVVLLAGRYSLLEQPALATMMPRAQARGTALILGGVFNSGILATGAVPGAKYNYAEAGPDVLDRVARIERICAAHGTALPHAALHFALAHPAVASVVLGAVRPEEVTRNIAALQAEIPSALWADLRGEGLLDPAAPVPD
ncbi:aldo/keto reductase [Pseudooceanicola marinus]|uniref:aldo/keto reductase n=1 Tax=Pseudooceanicola marinus TaxID=396013 RepID=UPI001CD1DBBD|nr:aldo/keto reductase [Pseudooceanicola marinus]MCA1335604.1 aldo/keto reductase [Pseudooceanicola marinus]